MEGEQHPTKVALRQARERVIGRLSEAFSRDELGLREFEQRVDAAYRGESVETLDRLTSDLEDRPLPVRAAVGIATTALVHENAIPRLRTTAVLGNVECRGRFALPDGARVLSVLGNVELDLRDVVLQPGITHVQVTATLGNVEIILPPDLPVECHGTGILGSVATVNRAPPEGHRGAMLRIIGKAWLGNIEIRTLPRAIDVQGKRMLGP